MTIRYRVDSDVIYHDATDTTLSIGSLSEHTMATATTAMTIAATVGTSSTQIVGGGPLSTLAVKNTGGVALRLADAITVPAGRLAVIPTTATITVSAAAGQGSYTAVWIG